MSRTFFMIKIHNHFTIIGFKNLTFVKLTPFQLSPLETYGMVNFSNNNMHWSVKGKDCIYSLKYLLQLMLNMLHILVDEDLLNSALLI